MQQKMAGVPPLIFYISGCRKSGRVQEHEHSGFKITTTNASLPPCIFYILGYRKSGRIQTERPGSQMQKTNRRILPIILDLWGCWKSGRLQHQHIRLQQSSTPASDCCAGFPAGIPAGIPQLTGRLQKQKSAVPRSAGPPNAWWRLGPQAF